MRWQYAYTFQTALGDDITCKYIVVFVYDTSHVRDKFFHPFYEVGMEVGLYATDGVIIHNQPSSAGLFENVQNLFPVTEAIEECCQCSEVHTETSIE